MNVKKITDISAVSLLTLVTFIVTVITPIIFIADLVRSRVVKGKWCIAFQTAEMSRFLLDIWNSLAEVFDRMEND